MRSALGGAAVAMSTRTVDDVEYEEYYEDYADDLDEEAPTEIATAVEAPAPVPRRTRGSRLGRE